MSQSGLAILLLVSRQGIDYLVETVSNETASDFFKPFFGKRLYLETGVKEFLGADILTSEFSAAIIEWYAFESSSIDKEKQELAKTVYRKFAKKGIDSWIQDITGWNKSQSNVSSISQHTSVYIKRLENSRDHLIDYEYWGVFQEAGWVFLMLEKEWKVPVEQFDLLDGSIGRKWSNYREDKSWAMPLGEYTHVFRDKRPSVVCNAFDHKELSHFKEWLDKVYVPQHLPEYLVSKFGRKATRLIYTENGHLTDEILHLTEIKRETQNMINQFQQFLLLRKNLLQLSD